MYRKNIYYDISASKKKEIDAFCNDYKDFLSSSKTERLAVAEIEKIAISKGFKPFLHISDLRAGAKIYFINRHKNIVLFRLGNRKLTDGLKILAAHIDSPRLDVKPNPIIESNEFVLFDTRYYGSIKNYQYVTIPLALHGVVYKKDSSHIDICIGEDAADPIIGITDLPIHLAGDQIQKTGEKLIEGEDLDVLVGSALYTEFAQEQARANILKILKNKYNFGEEDFLSAELEVVPAGRARDFGLDRSMIAGYGQDDRSCAYAILRAITDIDDTDNNVCAVFADKEEVGNLCASGAESVFFENTLLSLLNINRQGDLYSLRTTLENSYMIVCDSSAAIDPIYGNATDSNNGAKFNYGIVLEKHIGTSGKFGANDANPEFVAMLRNLLDEYKLHYQPGEIGRVDRGNGGTFSYIAARYNMDVIDSGITVLNMHSPMEIISKADLYEAYLFYKGFLLIENI